MSRARHMKKAEGGKVDGGGNPNVIKEAEDKGVTRKRGGGVEKKHLAMSDNRKAAMHLGRPGRKTGGRVGADKSPLSSAYNAASPSKAPD